MKRRRRRRFSIVTLALILFTLVIVLFAFIQWKLWNCIDPSVQYSWQLDILNEKLSENEFPFFDRQPNCTLANCFDIYRCLYSPNRLSIFVHRLLRVTDENGTVLTVKPSREFLELRSSIIGSRFFEPNQKKACLILPGIDTLAANRYLKVQHLTSALSHHKSWGKFGSNHLIFSLISSNFPTSQALVATTDLRFGTFRGTFDVSIPMWNPLTRDSSPNVDINAERPNLLTINIRFGSHTTKSTLFVAVGNSPHVFLLDTCPGLVHLFDTVCDQNGTKHSYSDMMQSSSFCAIIDGIPGFPNSLFDALKSGCIPVIFTNDFILPFSQVLDWKHFSIRLYLSQLPKIVHIVSDANILDQNRISDMRTQLTFIFNRYLKNISSLTLTTLRIIESRLFPNRIYDYQYWNQPPTPILQPPLFLPRTAPNEGFTAVILAFERINSLFSAIKMISRAPSLVKIVIVWNNPLTEPPKVDKWPRIWQPMRVIRSKENKLSNRFRPYSTIETEAVFSMDDDITMLTVDEIEFAYRTWREFPNRLIGFPPRIHDYHIHSKRLLYNSEWTGNISLVLTGAAFYHKLYGFFYHSMLPLRIRNFVDESTNCEDIAMNFLLANLTHFGPIKVTARKKFICFGCSASGISAENHHLKKRSECLALFFDIYRNNPLIIVEFRADPFLYKSPNTTRQFLQFPNVGQL